MLLPGSLTPARMRRVGTSQAAPRLLLRLAGACIIRLHLSNIVPTSNCVYSQLSARGHFWPMAASLSDIVPCFWSAAASCLSRCTDVRATVPRATGLPEQPEKASESCG